MASRAEVYEEAEEPKRKTKSDRLEELHSKALKQFDTSVCPLQEERALNLQDRRFAHIAGAQWEDEWLEQFENSIRVEINKTAAGLEKINTDYRENRVTVNFRPTDDKASEETADTLDGMFRADVYRCKGGQAFDNAFSEGTAGGMGAWRLCNEYEDEFDPDNDHQRIAFKTIPDADQTVFFDLNAKLYDKSDAMFAFVVTAMTPDAFKEEYGEDRYTSWPDELLKTHYDWYAPDIIRVADYYCVEIKTEKHHVFRNRVTDEEERYWESELDEDDLARLEVEGWQEVRQRPVKRRRVRKLIMSGSEVLKDCGYIAGDQIPIVPYYGKREFIDNMERVRGHVRLAKDPQRVYNSQISRLTEQAASAPIERPIFTPQQIAGHEQSWADANLNRAPYALANPLIDESSGQIIQTGPIGMVSPPQLSPVLATLIQVTGADIAELTNSADTSSEVRSNISAEAMDIAATRTDAKSGIYMDNFKQSMQRCGEIYLSMARDVYVEEGREVETLGEDGKDGRAVLAEPYTDPASKRYGIRNDIAKGKYKVISDVTEATATRRDKTVKTCLNGAQLIGATDPELAQALTITAFMNMDGEGITELQAWLRQRALGMGLVKPTDEEQQQMDEAQQSQQPDPQSQALQAVAEKESALAGKAVADTKQSEAKTVLTLAQAQKTAAEAGKTVEETQQIGRDAMQPANDTRIMTSPAQFKQSA